jgi:aminoglycoside phosphotransferase (APT) family kinase protein
LVEVDGVGSLSALRTLAANASTVSEERLESFLGEQSDLAGAGVSVRFNEGNLAAGASGGTLLFELTVDRLGEKAVEDFVLRFDLGSDGIFAQVSLEAQFEIMTALGAEGLRVPDARWIDLEGKIIDGASAIIMRRVHALSPCIQYLQMGPYAEALPATRRRMVEEMLAFAVQLHKIPAQRLNVQSLWDRGGAGGYFIDREIAWAQAELHARFPVVEEGERATLHSEMRSTLDGVADDLKRQAPKGLEPTIIHGDLTLANCMFNADGDLISLLDWELCHHGLPAEDVTYFLSAARVIASLGSTKVDPPSRDEVVGIYEAAGGKLEHWDYAAALSTFRLATWGAIGMRRMPREHWPAQKLMWELQKSELLAALEQLGEPLEV